MWNRRTKLSADSFHDPLARRVFIRSQREHRNRAASDAFWDGLWAGGTLSGKIFALVPFYLIASALWAVVSGVYEELVVCSREFRDWRRLRRFRKITARARSHRTTNIANSRACGIGPYPSSR